MLNNLNDEQVALMEVIKNKWISNAFTFKELTIEQAKEHVNFLYHKLKHPPKFICIADSMFSAQIIANIFPKILKDLKIKEKIGASVRDSVRASVREFFNFAYIGNGYDANWCAFYDYFRQINIIKNNENFDKYLSMLQAGIFETVLFENLAILIKNPKEVKLLNNRAHCENDAAVKWADGTEYYFWKGIMIPEKWIKEKNNLTFDDFIKESNIEKRRCLAEILGYEKLLKNAQLVDGKTDKGNELFVLKNAVNQGKDLYLLKYKCPSTDRVYVKPVPDNFRKADEAQGWSFGWTLQEYLKVEVEA